MCRPGGNTNKIRMDYIESEMARRHLKSPSNDLLVSDQSAPDGAGNPSEPKYPQRQPASIGKLHEIDLGPDSKRQNIARTEAATRKLAGTVEPAQNDTEDTSRLGKDGKPSRDKKRRNSDDIKRDQLVEEVLRESRRKFLPQSYFTLFFSSLIKTFLLTLNSSRCLRRTPRKTSSSPPSSSSYR